MQGIKFNQDGITSIIEGRKTMTRRPIKVRTDIDKQAWIDTLIHDYCKYKIGETVFAVDTDINKHFERCDFDDECDVCNNAEEGSYAVWYCSYDGEVDSYICGKCAKKAIDNMGEEFASIFLKITNIKVERLQDISEEDCIKEGVPEWLVRRGKTTVSRFKDDIWNKLPYQAPCDWNSNPFVFAYEFEVVR